MVRRILRHTVVLLALAVLASPGNLMASPSGSGFTTTRSHLTRAAAGPIDGIWRLLTNLWSEAGCILDPDGRCVANQGPASIPPAHAGCILDPSGRCASSAGADVQPIAGHAG
jgi:hypothetical protein